MEYDRKTLGVMRKDMIDVGSHINTSTLIAWSMLVCPNAMKTLRPSMVSMSAWYMHCTSRTD